jgi:two-component system chemotaxis response regulator CheB
MRKIRVLLADDAVVVRRLVSDVLAEDSEIEVVAACSNGRLAVARLPQVNPDVVILDVEMPDMDGLQALAAIRKEHRLLPIIMFSTLTQRGAEATLDALALGATDYVTKPANVGSVGAAMQAVRETLIPKIKLFCRGVSGRAPAGVVPSTTLKSVRSATAFSGAVGNAVRTVAAVPKRIDIVAIGTSTGGPDALNAILPQLPANFPVPIVIVQHMPPMFTRLLAERLDARCALRVREAAGGEALVAGQVFLAPGGFHLALDGEGATVKTRIVSGPAENSCCPAVDVLFRSVADHFAGRALGVVLTGMGQDGTRGGEQIYSTGGQIIAQDEASSIVWGMPGFVVQTGIAERILPLSEIASELHRRAAVGRAPSRLPAAPSAIPTFGGRA